MAVYSGGGALKRHERLSQSCSSGQNEKLMCFLSIKAFKPSLVVNRNKSMNLKMSIMFPLTPLALHYLKYTFLCSLRLLIRQNLFHLHNKNCGFAFVFMCNICRVLWVCVGITPQRRLRDKHMVTWAASTIASGGWVPYVTHSGIKEHSNTLAIQLFISFL